MWHPLLQCLHRSRFYEVITWLLCCLVSITALKILILFKINKQTKQSNSAAFSLEVAREKKCTLNSCSPCQEQVRASQHHLFKIWRRLSSPYFRTTRTQNRCSCMADVCWGLTVFPYWTLDKFDANQHFRGTRQGAKLRKGLCIHLNHDQNYMLKIIN